MKNNIEIPKEIKKYTHGKNIVKITKAQTSGDTVYRIENSFILKISENRERLAREMAANDFLDGKLPVSRTVCFCESGTLSYYLKTQAQGDPLVHKRYLSKPEKLIGYLAQAADMIHSVDINECKIKNPDSDGNSFVHGDLCLPNILVHGGSVTGIIDTESAGVGDPWIDYAWCVWSLEYNLGTQKYTDMLLKALGTDFDPDKYKKYTS